MEFGLTEDAFCPKCRRKFLLGDRFLLVVGPEGNVFAVCKAHDKEVTR